jgi:hypothetical protein
MSEWEYAGDGYYVEWVTCTKCGADLGCNYPGDHCRKHDLKVPTPSPAMFARTKKD